MPSAKAPPEEGQYARLAVVMSIRGAGAPRAPESLAELRAALALAAPPGARIDRQEWRWIPKNGGFDFDTLCRTYPELKRVG